MEAVRQSIAQFRKSIYGDEDVDFIDIFKFEMDEEDHEEMLSVMRESLTQVPESFKSEVIQKFLTEHPELKDHIVEQEGENKESTSEESDFDALRSSRWTEFNQEFIRELQSLAGTFSIFDPDNLWKMVSVKQRPYYEIVRVYAIQKIGNDINNSLYMHYKLNKCRMKNTKLSNQHFFIFSWTEDRFIARRHMKGVAWLDIFQKSLTEECLEAFKLEVDIIEMARLLKPVLWSFYSENKDFGTDAVEMINDAFNFVNIQKTIQQELEDSVAFFCERINQITNISLDRRSGGRDLIKHFFELETMATWVRDPIENRYQLNCIKDRIAQCEDYYNNKERQLKVDLKKVKRKHEVELYCFRNMMQSMYATIQNYKSRIATMTVGYDRRFAETNEKTTKLQARIDRLKIQREYLEAEKKYMNSRVREILCDISNGNVKSKHLPQKLSKNDKLNSVLKV